MSDDDGGSFSDFGKDLWNDVLWSSDAATGSWVAVDAVGAVHADAVASEAHPVREWCADIFVARSPIFAAIAAVNAPSSVEGGAVNRGAFVDDFLGDWEAPGWGALSCAAGTDWGVDGDVLR